MKKNLLLLLSIPCLCTIAMEKEYFLGMQKSLSKNKNIVDVGEQLVLGNKIYVKIFTLEHSSNTFKHAFKYGMIRVLNLPMKILMTPLAHFKNHPFGKVIVLLSQQESLAEKLANPIEELNCGNVFLALGVMPCGPNSILVNPYSVITKGRSVCNTTSLCLEWIGFLNQSKRLMQGDPNVGWNFASSLVDALIKTHTMYKQYMQVLGDEIVPYHQ